MIVIHKAKAENVKDIKKLLFETWTSVYSKTYPPEAIKIITSEWHNPVLLTKQIQDPSILFIIAKENNTLLAMCNTNKVEGEIVTVNHCDIEVAGQTAADIEQLTRRPGFDPRIFQDGIYITKKDGKNIVL